MHRNTWKFSLYYLLHAWGWLHTALPWHSAISFLKAYKIFLSNGWLQKFVERIVQCLRISHTRVCRSRYCVYIPSLHVHVTIAQQGQQWLVYLHIYSRDTSPLSYSVGRYELNRICFISKYSAYTYLREAVHVCTPLLACARSPQQRAFPNQRGLVKLSAQTGRRSVHALKWATLAELSRHPIRPTKWKVLVDIVLCMLARARACLSVVCCCVCAVCA